MSYKENSSNILNLPNEILLKIFKLAQNDKNLSNTCQRFFNLIPRDDENLLLTLDYNCFLTPSFNLDEFLKSSTKISFTIENYYQNRTENFDDQLEYFLQNYGEKIVKLIVKTKLDNFFTKYLPFMPNLEELHYYYFFYRGQPELENPNLKIFSIPLRKLFIDFDLNLKYFEIFKIKELCVDSNEIKSKQNLISFIRKQKYLEKLSLSSFKNFDCEEKLKRLNLKTLKLKNCKWNDERIFENFLKNQKRLKEFSVDKISNKIFIAICKHQKYLEKFEFDVFDDFEFDNFKNLSNLRFLNSLKIFTELNEKSLEEITKLKLYNLKILDLKIYLSFPLELIDEFASSFRNLKSLTLEFNEKFPIENVSKIMENFNNLEILNLKFINGIKVNENQAENFYSTSHKNENLKTLSFIETDTKLLKLIEKIVRDFPNLEFIDLNQCIHSDSGLELILSGLSKLKKISSYHLTKTDEEIFLKHGKNLRNFLVDLNTLENSAELLKNYSISIENMENYNEVTRENETLIEVTFDIYSQWQRMKTILDSTRHLKYLKIEQLNQNNNENNLIIKYLETVGKNIKNFKIRGIITDLQFKNFLDVLPNCETVKLDCNEFETVSEKFFNIENTKIKSFTVRVEFYGDYQEKGPEDVQKFLKNIKFPDESLNHFKFMAYYKNNARKSWIYSLFENFIENQNFNKSECWHYDRDYIFEFTKETKTSDDEDDDQMSLDSANSSDWDWKDRI